MSLANNLETSKNYSLDNFFIWPDHGTAFQYRMSEKTFSPNLDALGLYNFKAFTQFLNIGHDWAEAFYVRKIPKESYLPKLIDSGHFSDSASALLFTYSFALQNANNDDRRELASFGGNNRLTQEIESAINSENLLSQDDQAKLAIWAWAMQQFNSTLPKIDDLHNFPKIEYESQKAELVNFLSLASTLGWFPARRSTASHFLSALPFFIPNKDNPRQTKYLETCRNNFEGALYSIVPGYMENSGGFNLDTYIRLANRMLTRDLPLTFGRNRLREEEVYYGSNLSSGLRCMPPSKLNGALQKFSSEIAAMRVGESIPSQARVFARIYGFLAAIQALQYMNKRTAYIVAASFLGHSVPRESMRFPLAFVPESQLDHAFNKEVKLNPETFLPNEDFYGHVEDTVLQGTWLTRPEFAKRILKDGFFIPG